MGSTICPFCKEEIKEDAVVCKHCNQDLSNFRKQEVNQVEAENNLKKEKNKKALKIVGIVLLVAVCIRLWFISIPIIGMWYVWSKTKWNKKQKYIALGALCVLAIILISMNSYISQPPTITILEPTNNFTTDADSVTIKGFVKPIDVELLFNNQPIVIQSDGSFSKDIALGNEVNTVSFKATDNDKVTEQTLTINRTFTEEQKAELEKTRKEAAEKAKTDQITKDKEQLQRELDSFNTPFDSSAYRGSADALTMEAVIFNVWAQLINEYKESSDLELKSMANQLEQKVSQLQVKEFPLMRKNYADMLAEKLWEENLEVVIKGSSNDTLELISGVFASNKNIADIQSTIESMLELLRFSRVNYKWYKYDSDYTHYTIDSEYDSEVVFTN
ncbi:MAG: hypothetical protein ACKKL6_00565 [Candidatus Komeilibacteria bacterium]